MGVEEKLDGDLRQLKESRGAAEIAKIPISNPPRLRVRSLTKTLLKGVKN